MAREIISKWMFKNQIEYVQKYNYNLKNLLLL